MGASANAIIYNVTVSVDTDCAEDWLAWMREVHLPEVLATGHFTEAKLSRILAESHNGVAYSIQYTAQSMEAFQVYERTHASALRQKHEAAFGGKTAAFRTLLEVLHHC